MKGLHRSWGKSFSALRVFKQVLALNQLFLTLFPDPNKMIPFRFLFLSVLLLGQNNSRCVSEVFFFKRLCLQVSCKPNWEGVLICLPSFCISVGWPVKKLNWTRMEGNSKGTTSKQVHAWHAGPALPTCDMLAGKTMRRTADKIYWWLIFFLSGCQGDLTGFCTVTIWSNSPTMSIIWWSLVIFYSPAWSVFPFRNSCSNSPCDKVANDYDGRRKRQHFETNWNMPATVYGGQILCCDDDSEHDSPKSTLKNDGLHREQILCHANWLQIRLFCSSDGNIREKV